MRGGLLDRDRSFERDKRRLRAREIAARAFDKLAPDFARSVIPFTPEALAVRCDKTLDALTDTYGTLERTFHEHEDAQCQARVLEIKDLRKRLQVWCNEDAVANRFRRFDAIKELESRNRQWSKARRERAWELTQVQMALSRVYVARLDPPWDTGPRGLVVMVGCGVGLSFSGWRSGCCR
jgi:hypothetical protein